MIKMAMTFSLPSVLLIGFLIRILLFSLKWDSFLSFRPEFSTATHSIHRSMYSSFIKIRIDSC